MVVQVARAVGGKTDGFVVGEGRDAYDAGEGC